MSNASDWPGWPAGESGMELSDIEVDKPLEEIFLLIHGSHNTFREKTAAANKYQACASSSWKSSIEDAVLAPPSNEELPGLAALKPGMAVKRTFLTPAMGGMCQTTEVFRAVDVVPEKHVILESTIITAAKYGDKFRIVWKRTMTALGPKRTRIQTIGTIIFIGSVNGMIKGIIKNAGLNGMKDSMAKMEQVLAEYATVRPFKEGAPIVTRLPSLARPAVAEVGPVLAVLHQLVGVAVVDALRPWATLLHGAVGHLPLLRRISPDVVLTAAVVLFGMEVIRAVLIVMRFAQAAGREPQDVLSWAAHQFFEVVYVPKSVFQVITTACIALLARALVGRVASMLPAPPSGGSRPPSAQSNSTTAVGGGEVEGRSGVKYDGYSQAIASTRHEYVGQRTALQKIDGQSEVALETIRNGLLNVGKIGKIGDKSKGHKKKKKEKGKKGGGGAESGAEGGEGPSGGSSVTSSSKLSKSIRKSIKSPGTIPSSPTSVTIPDEEAVLLSSEGYSGPDLPPALRSQAIVESVFENERLQPFRGWGHTWPGHFLPTDATSHWSLMNPATGVDTVYSQSLAQVVPQLPPGWRWVEPDWHLDLTGVFSDATDNNGWSYGLDFPWVVPPFTPGNGRKKLADFVRRRRWLRTRVPIELFMTPASTAVYEFGDTVEKLQQEHQEHQEQGQKEEGNASDSDSNNSSSASSEAGDADQPAEMKDERAPKISAARQEGGASGSSSGSGPTTSEVSPAGGSPRDMGTEEKFGKGGSSVSSNADGSGKGGDGSSTLGGAGGSSITDALNQSIMAGAPTSPGKTPKIDVPPALPAAAGGVRSPSIAISSGAASPLSGASPTVAAAGSAGSSPRKHRISFLKHKS